MSGSYYVQREELPWEAFVLAVPVGLLAAAILVVNNVRDMETDRRAGKRTLAVRARARAHARPLRGDARAGATCARRCRGCSAPRAPWLLLLLAERCRSPCRCAHRRTHTDGPTLNDALARTGMLSSLFCVLLSAGLLLS